MNKQELVSAMVKDSSITKLETVKFIDSLIEVISAGLKAGDKITLVGFGTFKTQIKKEKKGRNPKTGKEIIIPKKKVAKFVPGKQLKELVK